MRRVILHVDMDAFYAAVEQRDDPRLRGKPIIVGGPGKRGVVTTASYEARPYGVRSAMPMAQAVQLCPQALVVPVRMQRYSEVSREVMQVLGDFSPLVEPLSLDEAFVDMTGSEALFGNPETIAENVQLAVRDKTGLGCSVGVATNKFLAKLASDLDKPNGITVVPFGDEARFIAPLELRRLWGVGPRAAERLAELGLSTIGELAATDLDHLERALGPNMARHLHALAHGSDDRRVVQLRDRKSVGSEVTLDRDVRGLRAVERVLRRQCVRVAQHLRSEALVASGVRVKLRYSRGFRLATRQCALDAPCDDSLNLFRAARELLSKLELEQPIRLVGVAAFALSDAEAPRQRDLFSSTERMSALEHAVDRIRDRFGDKIGYGSS
ncbi:MAG TPA: DNA polymerase IV [Polyangiaceae bacterium]|nr:DNA polymerase IV [Polyangiaceae bacterium]